MRYNIRESTRNNLSIYFLDSPAKGQLNEVFTLLKETATFEALQNAGFIPTDSTNGTFMPSGLTISLAFSALGKQFLGLFLKMHTQSPKKA